MIWSDILSRSKASLWTWLSFTHSISQSRLYHFLILAYSSNNSALTENFINETFFFEFYRIFYYTVFKLKVVFSYCQISLYFSVSVYGQFALVGIDVIMTIINAFYRVIKSKFCESYIYLSNLDLFKSFTCELLQVNCL